MSTTWFPLALVLHATGVALALVLRRRPAACRWAAFLGSAGGSLATFVLGASVLANGPLLFVRFLVGFGVTAGVVPLHVWLPEAHPAAPSNVSALMSGGLVNAGLYGLVRVGAGGLGRPEPGWGMGVLLLGSRPRPGRAGP
jgi:NADH:ubiquinone oxidoreductase subunit 2 (subunit N)